MSHFYENTLKLTHHIFYEIFNKKIYQNFLVKNVIQKFMCLTSRQNDSFIFPQNRATEAKVLKSSMWD